jgi:putative addiction module killer protein
MIEVIKDDGYTEWFNSLTKREQLRVDARITRIEKHEHFGKVRKIDENIAELKWENGWRVYFSNIGYKKIILIIGGHKNEQEKDIKKARIFIKRSTTH